MIVRGAHDAGAAVLPLELHATPLVIFDSDCVFCSRSMRLLTRLDRRGHFRFASAQGPIGQALYAHLGLPLREFESNIVIDGGAFHLKSDSLIAIARRLPWPWRAAVALRVAPTALRDAAYDFVARRRYRIFGRRDACGLADPEIARRLV